VVFVSWCSKRSPFSCGRATAFRGSSDRWLVDNGQHVLLGCYTRHWRFSGYCAAGHVRLVSPVGDDIDRQVVVSKLNARSSGAVSPSLGVFDWEALSLTDLLVGPRRVRLDLGWPSQARLRHAALAASPGWVVGWGGGGGLGGARPLTAVGRATQNPRIPSSVIRPRARLVEPVARAASTFARVLGEISATTRKSAPSFSDLNRCTRCTKQARL